MSDLRVVWRMAPWWGWTAMVVVAAFFGWVIREGLASTSGEVYIHTIIPAYGLFLYATLAALLNRRSVVATREGLLVTNGPIPVGNGKKSIPREEIAFTWHVPIETSDDSGGTIVLWHCVGVKTRAGRDVQLFPMIKTADEARASAKRVADALGSANDWSVVPVREPGMTNEDPADKRVVKTWVGLITVAIAAGIVWEMVWRSAGR
jgi:hypothetical protein